MILILCYGLLKTASMYLVVGGSKGIGLECVRLLLKKGFEIAATHNSSEPPLIASHLHWFECDLGETTSINQFTYKFPFAKLDGLILNAGNNIIKPIDDYDVIDVESLFQLNLLSHFQLIKLFLPKLRLGRNPSIVGVSSIWGSLGLRNRTLYAATKGGMEAMYRALADELCPDILVNTVAPGFTATELTLRSLGVEGYNKLSKQIPLSRLAKPSEIAEVIIGLLGHNNTYITGQCVTVDGGFTSSARCL